MTSEIGAREEIDRTEPERAPLPDPTGLAHTLSPVDLPDPPAPLPGSGLVWTSTVIAIATAVLLLFNAVSLRGWAYQLEPNDTTAKVVSVAEAWYDTTGRLGLNRPVAMVHDFWRSVMARRFSGQTAAATESVD